ncbi:hypothetical protein C8J57DRAFT_1612844 [Mycena rebaudengoi]|nr:hypothetical protein C8J57DRAFT_1612844 [Mycena rebaudengoi]
MSPAQMMSPQHCPKDHRSRYAQYPVIFVIVNKSGPRPSTLNISVGVSVLASAPDAAIIYKDVDTDYIFVVAAKGAFDVLTEGFEIDLEQWESMPRFHNEAAFKAALKTAEITGGAIREDHSAIDLGRAWQAKHGCLVDMDTLLAQMTVTPQSITQSEFLDLLEEETFGALALVCKTRGLLPNLRAWLIARKERASIWCLWWRFEMFLVRRGYSSSYEILVRMLRMPCLNLEDYHARLNNSQPSPLLPHVNRCLATLTLLEKSGYGADILDRRSNRAMRATLLTTLSLDDDVEAYHSTCPICCCDNTIMSLALKASAKPGDNTTDFALNFPLAAGAAQDNVDILSAQYVCFQFALAMHQMSPERGSMYNEPIVAVLPLTKYVGVNRAYITNCLATVITNGLVTGASGLCQLFMGVLLTTMKTREWAKESEADEEIKARCAGMRWMLENLGRMFHVGRRSMRRGRGFPSTRRFDGQ